MLVILNGLIQMVKMEQCLLDNRDNSPLTLEEVTIKAHGKLKMEKRSQLDLPNKVIRLFK